MREYLFVLGYNVVMLMFVMIGIIMNVENLCKKMVMKRCFSFWNVVVFFIVKRCFLSKWKNVSVDKLNMREIKYKNEVVFFDFLFVFNFYFYVILVNVDFFLMGLFLICRIF